MENGVRFIRKNGRIIPIHASENSDFERVKKANEKIYNRERIPTGISAIAVLPYALSRVFRGENGKVALAVAAPYALQAGIRAGLKGFESKEIKEARARIRKSNPETAAGPKISNPLKVGAAVGAFQYALPHAIHFGFNVATGGLKNAVGFQKVLMKQGLQDIKNTPVLKKAIFKYRTRNFRVIKGGLPDV